MKYSTVPSCGDLCELGVWGKPNRVAVEYVQCYISAALEQLSPIYSPIYW